jgi:hypothetical protein
MDADSLVKSCPLLKATFFERVRVYSPLLFGGTLSRPLAIYSSHPTPQVLSKQSQGLANQVLFVCVWLTIYLSVLPEALPCPIAEVDCVAI